MQTFEAQLERVYEAFLSACSDIEVPEPASLAGSQRNPVLRPPVPPRGGDDSPTSTPRPWAKACQEFSHRFQKPRGLYITPKNVDDMETLARHMDAKAVRIIVVTDSQGILGIGDQGVGYGHSHRQARPLYPGAGIHPACCLPIALDVGTDNQALLDDPMYLGQPTGAFAARSTTTSSTSSWPGSSATSPTPCCSGRTSASPTPSTTWPATSRRCRRSTTTSRAPGPWCWRAS